MSETTERTVWEHGWAIRDLQEGQAEVKKDVNNILTERERDRIAFAKFVATVEGAANAAREAADKSVTGKQFWLGVVVVASSIVGTLLGIHA